MTFRLGLRTKKTHEPHRWVRAGEIVDPPTDLYACESCGAIIRFRRPAGYAPGEFIRPEEMGTRRYQEVLDACRVRKCCNEQQAEQVLEA